MQKVKKYSRQLLVLILALATALTCFLILAPQADAADGEYKYKVEVNITDSCKASAGHVKLYYKTQNGINSSETELVITEDSGMWNSATVHTFEGTCSGFPVRVNTRCKMGRFRGVTYYCTLYVYNNNTGEWVKLGESGKQDYSNKDRNVNTNADTALYPYVSTAAFSVSNPVYVNTDGSKVDKTVSVSATDQYGVGWVNAPSSWSKSSSNVTLSGSGKSITASFNNTSDSKDYTTTFSSTWSTANPSNSSVTKTSGYVQVYAQNVLIDEENFSVTVNSSETWTDAVSCPSGSVVNITVTGDFDAGGKLTAIPQGVTVNLNMNGHTIYWDYEGSSYIPATSYTSGTYADGTYWGLITNNGTLNITGTGTIRNKRTAYGVKDNNKRGDYPQRLATIVNNGTGTLTVGGGITVQAYLGNMDHGDNYKDQFLYNCGIYNEGTLTSAANIDAGCMAGAYSGGTNSYHYAISYGIYGGNVTTNGGTINVEAYSGGYDASRTCSEGNQMVEIAVGVYSNSAKIMGTTTINTLTKGWQSKNGNDNWGKQGYNIMWSAGVMYTTTNYPIIGAGVNIDASFRMHISGDLHMPGTSQTYRELQCDDEGPHNHLRRANAVVGVTQNVNTIGKHTSEKTFYADGGFFGSIDAPGANNDENYLDFAGSTNYYRAEDPYYNNLTATAYTVDTSSHTMSESGRKSDEFMTSSIRNGAPGTDGTQYLIMYRYYKNSMNRANLQSVSYSYDPNIQATCGYLKVANQNVCNGIVPDSSDLVTFGGGGVSKNSYYYEFLGATTEKVASKTYAARSLDDLSAWSGGTTALSSGGTTVGSGNTLIVYLNYVQKVPTSVHIAVADKDTQISQYTDTMEFTATYTGKALVPGTDFNIGIIDMGKEDSIAINDMSDDTVVTDVYNITGNGSGSGNNSTAVTYRYTTDAVPGASSTWVDGLPKDAGKYVIEVKVNADTTLAPSGTYNRLGTLEYVTCTIHKADPVITGDSFRISDGENTLEEIIPFTDYTVTGIGSDSLSGTWSFDEDYQSSDFLKEGCYHLNLIWTPTPGSDSETNYNPAIYSITIFVNKRFNFTVPADCVYDGQTHEATVTVKDAYAGYVGEVTIKYNGSDTLPKNVGTYIVTFDVATPELQPGDSDYNENYYGPVSGLEVGTFTIEKAPYTVTVNAEDKVYDGMKTATATVDTTGVIGSDDVALASGYTFAFDTANVGTDITVTASGLVLTGATASNYKLVPVNGTADITPRTLTAKANGVTKVYDGSGTVNVTFSNISGYADVDSASTVYFTSGKAVAVSANVGAQVLTDIIYTLGGSSAGNYVVSINNIGTASVDITPADPVVTAPTITGLTYNSARTLQSVDLSAFTDSNGYWQFDDLTVVPTVTVKKYAATYYPSSSNYKTYSTQITVDVDPAPVVLRAEDKVVQYGQKAPTFTIVADGLTGLDQLGDIGGSGATATTTYFPGEPVGSYAITVNYSFDSDNYVFSTQPGTLIVTPATLVVQATADSKVYDGSTDVNVNFTIASGKFGMDDVSLTFTSTTGTAATANAGNTTVTYTAPQLKGAKADNYEIYVSPASGELTVEIIQPASPVESFSAIPGTYCVTLSWSEAVEETVTGYRIYRKTEDSEFALLTTISSRDTLSYVDNSLTAGTEYIYCITAMQGDVEGEWSDEITAVPDIDREAPVLTSLTPASYSTLSKTVTITASATDNIEVVRYEASYSADDGATWQTVAAAAGKTCRMSLDTTKISDGVILFRVLAFDAQGNSGGSNRIYTYKIDNTGPAKVEGLATVVVYPTQMTISWERPLDEDTDHFVLQQKTGDTLTTVSSKIQTLGYNLSGLSPKTKYQYRVMAVDAYGNEGEYSDWLTVTTPADTSAPVVTAQSQNSGAYNTDVTYSATIVDDYAVASVSIQYSTDKTNWTQLDSFDFATDQKKVGITKNIDLTAFNEGSLYIRAVGTDRFGNVGDETTSAPFVEYLVDRTAPDCVRNVSATVSDKTVIVRWEAVSASDVASYSLYRSTSAGDNYSCIAQNIKKLSYSDSGVARNQTYYYKVLAVDNAGNSSALSEFCSASVYSDVIAPIIGSVSPNGGTIGPVNKTVSIAVSDNDMLMKLSVACKKSGDEDYIALQDFDLSGSSQTISLDLPLDEYTNGEAVQLRIVCTDKAGLVSSPAYFDYIIDKEAPNVADVNITGKEGSATITWADCGESDLSGFEIYRCDSANTLVGKRAVNTSGVYTLTDYVTQQLVRYRIDAVDKYGNRNSVFTDEVSTQIVLKPSITLPEKLTAETELVFSAENSISAFGIASYSWKFDDGETDSGEKIVKTFENAGTFMLTLTVTDIKGNTASVSKSFVVQEYSRTGILKVRVLSDSGNAIRNCGVYVDLGSSSQRVLYTSSSGVLTTEVPVGVHEIGAYCDGYLPKSATVAVSADNTSEITFELTEQNIVTGDFEVHEMNFQEIVAAGIDVSDPANQQIYKVNVTLIYGDEEVPVTYIRSATEIKEYVIRDSDTSAPQTNYKYDIKYIPNDGNEEIIAVVRLPIRASYLKQFFMATLTIFNNADSDYRLVDCSASIPVPAGLTVMNQSAIDSVIPGGSSARYTLVLRGDTPGTYTLTANFNGTLEKFNKSVNASFTSNSFRVYDKSDVAIVVEIPKQTVGQFRFNIGIENRRGAAIYSPQIDIDGMVQDITTMFKKSLQEDAEYEEGDIKNLKFEGIGSFVRNADGSATTYDSCSIPVDTLESGCGVFLEYQTIDMPADGAEGWFSKAVIECEDGFGGYIEVRFLEDSTIPIGEDEYIDEHLNFASSSNYAVASFDFAGYMHDAVKDSKEYAELNILDWSLSDVTDEAFNKLNDEIAADYIAQILDSATDEKKIELKFMKTFSGIVDHLSDMLIADEDLGNKELVKNKIDKMLEGTDYDSSTNELLQQLLGKYMSTETLNDIYGVYDTVDNLSSVYHCAADEVEGIKRLTTYVAAIAAYQEVEEEIKQNLLNTAEKMENSRMKTALLRYANTAIDEESYKSELRNMAIHNYVGNVYTFLKFSYGSVIEKTIKKVTVNVLDKILPLADAASISSDLSVSVGWISAGREVLSALSSADKQRESLKILIRLADATAASGAVLADAKADLEANRDIASAKAFDTAFKAYKRWQLMAYSAFEDYGNALTDNFIAKYIAKKSREEHLSALADVIAQENRLKGIYCHTKGHELASDGVKVLAVACPVDVKLYSPQGVLTAQIVSGTADVYDELVSCFVFGEEKLFAVPSGLDYQIEITATGTGTMDYTVFEYSDGTEKREISFPEQTIEVDDQFCGSTGILVEEDTETYSLLKNGSDTVITDGQTVIGTTGVTLDEDAVILDKGNTFALHAQVQPDGTSDVKWKSSDESVCTVDSNGQLTAISCGEAVIYAISLDGGYVDTAAVTVNEHTFDDGVVTVAATCTADGVRTFTCTSCGETRTEIISASGHNWSEWSVVYAADCENTGLEQRLCLNDKTHVETRETAQTDHVDLDADGYCDICDADVSTENSPGEQTPNCVCGENHTGMFAWLIKFFHRIYYFFKHLFGSN